MKTEQLLSYLIVISVICYGIASIIAGQFNEKVIIANSKHASYSAWYQAKSIKQGVIESELSMLRSIRETLPLENKSVFDNKINYLKDEVNRYEKEKTEILAGSKNILEKDWTQDLGGKMGAITGMTEWEEQILTYERAQRKLNTSELFCQLSVVFLLLCFLLQESQWLKQSFYWLGIMGLLIGLIFLVQGYSQGMGFLELS